MSKRMTESQIVSILKEADAGVPVKELCRQHGIVNRPGFIGDRFA
jgi:putative transposase